MTFRGTRSPVGELIALAVILPIFVTRKRRTLADTAVSTIVIRSAPTPPSPAVGTDVSYVHLSGGATQMHVKES